jgi:hypothetical protein
VKTKITGKCIRETGVSEPKPLRFCDLEVGDVFRWIEFGDADRGDSGGLRQKVSSNSYRHLTAATATAMSIATATEMVSVERYDIEINLHNPCRVRQE